MKLNNLTLPGRLLIVDLESTCWKSKEDQKDSISEIIEFGYCPFENGNIEKAGSIFITPVFSKVSEFCIQLTSITSKDLTEKGLPIANAYNRINQVFQGYDIWGSWGDYDKNQMHRMFDLYGITNFLPSVHINIKRLYGKIILNKDNMKKGSPVNALNHFGKSFEGTHHRGEDDSYNIARVYQILYDHEM